MSRCAWFASLLALSACLGDAPRTQVRELDPVCEGTKPGHACITLIPSATEAVMEELAGDTEGAFHWALYEDGEVGSQGPDDREDYEIAGEYVINLKDEPKTGAVTIVDFEPGWFQVMAYFQPSPEEDPGEGDALTLPTRGFEAPADAHTTVDVVLDFVR